MKLFLMAVTVCCFMFGTIFGANLHTLMDLRHSNFIAAKFIEMTVQQLTEVDI